MHIFPFSARKGTPAEKFAGAVTEAVKKKRADILGRIDETMHKAFLQAMVGQTAEVLFEQPDRLKIYLKLNRQLSARFCKKRRP